MGVPPMFPHSPPVMPPTASAPPMVPPGDHTHATGAERVFGVTPVLPLRPPAPPRAAVAGNLLVRLNTTFAAGLRGAGIYTRTDRQDAVFAPGSAPGSRALALQPDQAFLSEMFFVAPGRYTLAFDLRAPHGVRVEARVSSSWQTPEGEVRRPLLGELAHTSVSHKWIRIALPVLVPEGCPGVNLQIGETRALRDAFSIDAPGWSPHGEDASAPVVLLDRLSLRADAHADYVPPASLELGLDSPASPGLTADAGSPLPLVLSLAHFGDAPAEFRLSGRSTDILYGTAHPLPLPAAVTLAAGETRALPFDLAALPAGQFVVEIDARYAATDTHVSVARVASFLSPARPIPADTPFLGRALYNSASHESCYVLGAPSSRLLGDGMPFPLNWQIVQPAPGPFVWEDSDRFVRRLADAGIAPLVGLLNYNHRSTTADGLSVLAPPPWVAAELPAPGAWPTLRKAVPRDLSLWCDYVRAVATRYRREIRAWEVLNEPGGTMDAAAYVRLLAAAHRTLKEVDPGFTVVGVCSTGDEVEGVRGGLVRFLEDCLALGAAEHLDVLSFHPYVWPHSPERGGLPEALAAIVALRDRHAPGRALWCTEFGWNSPVVAPGRLRTERGPSRNLCAGEYTALDSANFVARGLLHQLGAGIEKIHLFNNPQPGRLHPFRANGLVLFDYDRTPLPVFLAAREVMHRFAATRLVLHREFFPGAYYQLHYAAAPARHVLAVWRREAAAHGAPPRFSFSLPPGARAAPADLFGRPAALQLAVCDVPLTASPAYVELSGADTEALLHALPG